MKFKIGNKVRVKSLDWYNENKEYNGDITIGNYNFDKAMSKYCGMTAMITGIAPPNPFQKGGFYLLDIDKGRWSWEDCMFEDEEVTGNEQVIKEVEMKESFKIEKGDAFTCIKDVVMNDGFIAYKKGGYYTSEFDYCITDENHDKEHYWLDKREFEEHFEYFEYGLSAKVLSKNNDNVNHPKHYTSHPSSVECIEITKHYDFCVGNAIKYLWRAGLKSEQGYSSDEKQIEDLKKAVWYIQEKIKMLEK